MTASTLLRASHIVPELRSPQVGGVFDELLDLLQANGSLPAELRSEASRLLLAREGRMSTGIGRAVAVPHATVPGLPHIVAAFGRSRSGVDFNAMDDQPVHFVFLLLVPPNQTGEHLALLSSIAHWLTTPGHADRLRYAEGSDALSAVLAPAGT